MGGCWVFDIVHIMGGGGGRYLMIIGSILGKFINFSPTICQPVLLHNK